jgi:lauroyl/myristoyl acyltransferase
MTARELEEGAVASSFEENIGAVREILPGGWRPRLRIEGSESLERAALRQGTILWTSAFYHSDLVTKKALAEAGYVLHHLSELSHPFSPTRYGVWVLNTIRLWAENRYLARRIIVSGDAQQAVLALAKTLRRHGVVSITAVGSGTRVLEVPLLGGTLRLGAGAPVLALRTGAALLPVFTVLDSHGRYTVRVGPDISDVEEASDDERVQLMASRYAMLLQPYLLAYPTQWRGWALKCWAPPPEAMTVEERTERRQRRRPSNVSSGGASPTITRQRG